MGSLTLQGRGDLGVKLPPKHAIANCCCYLANRSEERFRVLPNYFDSCSVFAAYETRKVLSPRCRHIMRPSASPLTFFELKIGTPSAIVNNKLSGKCLRRFWFFSFWAPLPETHNHFNYRYCVMWFDVQVQSNELLDALLKLVSAISTCRQWVFALFAPLSFIIRHSSSSVKF